MFPNAFLSSIARKFESMIRFEDPELHQAVLADVPVTLLEQRAQERLRVLQKRIHEDGTEDINISIQEMMLLEALTWFKNWMEWINEPECDKCDKQTKFSHVSQDSSLLKSTGADRIEMFHCVDPECGHMTAFERHSDPARAWAGQKGRCGEWATAFTLLCRALKWEARLISSSSDHAWTEVYSIAQQRWLHADPCENVCDQPLIYETGWGTKLAYVIAYAYDDLQDVTWRYSAKHKDVIKNRNICSEIDLLDLIINLRELKQARFSSVRRAYLIKRTAFELVEMLLEKKITEDDKQGRTSGSLSWRLQRGETKINQQKIWSPTQEDIAQGQMTIRYSIIRDCYERIQNDKCVETIDKWENGVLTASGIFKKEEKDWKIIYLCREESTNEGKIQWRFSTGNGRNIIKITIHCLNKTFESGQVILTLTGDNKSVEFSSTLDTEDFRGLQEVTLTARLGGGSGACSWQHAQLFRQPIQDAHNIPFFINITFK